MCALHEFTVERVFRCSCYRGYCYSCRYSLLFLPLQFDVKEAKHIEHHPQWDISDDEGDKDDSDSDADSADEDSESDFEYLDD